MLVEPKCSERRCRHFLGAVSKDENDPEVDQRPCCTAFPQGIPVEISYGENDHTTPYPGDRGIQYEPE